MQTILIETAKIRNIQQLFDFLEGALPLQGGISFARNLDALEENIAISGVSVSIDNV